MLLAPMEDVTDLSFRLICRELGADMVFTEFVNSEGLVRGSEKTHKKLLISDKERPVGIQIYGGRTEAMIGAAQFAEEQSPEVIDINAGCWVKNVVGCGAGAALLKDPETMQRMIGEVVKAVNLPVTVKTRLGWDQNTINILEIAKRLEDVGVAGLTIHCRTRTQGHRGDPDWSWIERIKNIVTIPVVLNGGIMTAEDAVKAFNETPADGIMIARGAIGNPWLFSEIKSRINGEHLTPVSTVTMRIEICLKHLRTAIEIKGEKRAVIEHRKFYTGYLKGLYNASSVRMKLMNATTFQEVSDILYSYQEILEGKAESVTGNG